MRMTRAPRWNARAVIFWREADGCEVNLLTEDGLQLNAVEVNSAKTIHPDFNVWNNSEESNHRLDRGFQANVEWGRVLGEAAHRNKIYARFGIGDRVFWGYAA